MLLACLLAACGDPSETVAVSSGIQVAGQQSGLVFDPPELDLGEAKEGDKVTAVLLLRNNGQGFAQIARVETSCGCTTAEPETRMLAPGAFTRLRVEIDTFGKRGKTRKWVKVFDQQGRETTAWLTLFTRDNPHLKADNRSLFDGQCASCHFQPAAGLTDGKAIYKAVCAMCHGADAKGGYAPALSRLRDADALKGIIAHGTGTAHMPGFARAAGGPLDGQQLDALVRWVLSLDD